MEPAAVKKARISDEDVPLLAEYRDFMRDILAAADVIDDCVRRLHEEVSAACAGAMAATVSVQTSLTSLSLGAKEALRTTSASNSKKLEYHMEELDAVDKAAMAASRLATGLIGSQEVNDPVLLAALEVSATKMRAEFLWLAL